MPTITIEEAQARLPELIGGLSRGEELAVTQGGRVVARIVGERAEGGRRPGPGLGKVMLTVVAEDDEHLKDFAG
jgi:antitoxin (DNA-binding transcriptional repressor) of toxin-antitoxin stability system